LSIDPRVLRTVTDRMAARRLARESEYAQRRAQVYSLIPRIREIDLKLKSTAMNIIRACTADGRDPAPILESLKEENLALQEESRDILEAEGFPQDYLDETPDCPRCRDTGYVYTEPCRCLLEECAAEQAKRLSCLLDTEGKSFETFDFSLFSPLPDPEFSISPREMMERIYDYCVDWANNFSPRSDNLFITGKTGVGKTFLSACIARDVAAGGASVTYDTAIRIMECCEEDKFRNDPEAASQVHRYERTDLLIIDDLGTEFITPFASSSLYSLINTRLVGGKKTIINSNLTIQDMRKRYIPQIMSRLEGEYKNLYLIGDDLRLKKDRFGETE